MTTPPPPEPRRPRRPGPQDRPKQRPPKKPEPGAQAIPVQQQRPSRRARPRPFATSEPTPPQGPQPKPRRRPSLRGENPTETIPLRGSLRGTPYRDPRVTRAVAEEQAAASAMDLALRVAEIMLRCGSSASAVEAASTAVGVAAGLEDMDVDLTMQSMHMQCRTPSGQTISRLRVVRQPRRDFGRLAQVHSLVDDLVDGDVDIEQAQQRLKEINTSRRTWSRWVVTCAEGSVAAGVALMLGASPGGLVLAFLAVTAVGGVAKLVSGLNLPDFYLSALGGAAATIVAFCGYLLSVNDAMPLNPSDFVFAMAGGIVFLLPSLTLTSAMEDVLSGFPVTGTARLFEVMLHTFGLIIGVAGGLGLSLQAVKVLHVGLRPPPLDKLEWATAPFPLVLLGAGFIGLTGAMTMLGHERLLLWAGGLSAVGVAAASFMTDLGVGRVTATGLAAVVIGFCSRVVALRRDAPALTIQVPATFGLLPGLAIFLGLYHMVGPADVTEGSTVQQGIVEVLTALGIIMAIATGATLGDRLAAPFDSPVAQRRRESSARDGERRKDDEWEEA